MAKDYCPICGKKYSMFSLNSAPKPSENDILLAQSLGVYQDGMCADCIESESGKRQKILDAQQREKDQLEKQQKAELNKLPPKERIVKEITGFDYAQIMNVFISPEESPANSDENFGIVTGYSVIGTGPISTIASSWTDFFGKESIAYQEKIEKAEELAIIRMRGKALEMGANAIYNAHINITEAASGHGMIIVAVYGTAIKTRTK